MFDHIFPLLEIFSYKINQLIYYIVVETNHNTPIIYMSNIMAHLLLYWVFVDLLSVCSYGSNVFVQYPNAFPLFALQNISYWKGYLSTDCDYVASIYNQLDLASVDCYNASNIFNLWAESSIDSYGLPHGIASYIFEIFYDEDSNETIYNIALFNIVDTTNLIEWKHNVNDTIIHKSVYTVDSNENYQYIFDITQTYYDTFLPNCARVYIKLDNSVSQNIYYYFSSVNNNDSYLFGVSHTITKKENNTVYILTCLSKGKYMVKSECDECSDYLQTDTLLQINVSYGFDACIAKHYTFFITKNVISTETYIEIGKKRTSTENLIFIADTLVSIGFFDLRDIYMSLSLATTNLIASMFIIIGLKWYDNKIENGMRKIKKGKNTSTIERIKKK
eukprot:500139_1